MKTCKNVGCDNPALIKERRLECQDCKMLRLNYGINSVEKKQMLKDQGGKCDICNSWLSYEVSQLDHCHITGKIRAVLCKNCNWLLGQAKDDPAILQSAINYLERFKDE